MPLVRKSALAGEIEERETTNFMKLIDYLADQKSSVVNEQVFRDNYRKRSLNQGPKKFSKSTFILPESSPSKTNILGSSNTFRTLNAQRLQKHANSVVGLSGKKTVNTAFASLPEQRAST